MPFLAPNNVWHPTDPAVDYEVIKFIMSFTHEGVQDLLSSELFLSCTGSMSRNIDTKISKEQDGHLNVKHRMASDM